ncbi:hypothetical protein, partial [Thalassospira profundimaris]|uniref:hypothetical protein n=1 Tax=Thalassospira profundimaris TaxID=502049 RepID=UPI001C68A686
APLPKLSNPFLEKNDRKIQICENRPNGTEPGDFGHHPVVEKQSANLDRANLYPEEFPAPLTPK